MCFTVTEITRISFPSWTFGPICIHPDYKRKGYGLRLLNYALEYASRATFPSAFVRKCLEADPTKDCYENRLTTGTRIDGEIISLDAISRYNHWAVGQFRKALKERRNFNSGTFTFRGYDGSLWIEVKQKDDNYNYYKAGDIAAGFSKEYRGCANGYYYALIDDEHFIGIDID